MIDLRSDTVTKPTEGMLKDMVEAKVGDDVFEEDPTVNAFQEKIARLFGFEAGLFVSSGVMGNQIAINLLTEPGDEVIIEQDGHVPNYEAASAAFLSSVQLNTVKGQRGKLNAKLIKNVVRPVLDWAPHTSLMIIENTTNKGGGVCYTKAELEEIGNTITELGLLLHIDGARIWNALEATGMEPAYFGSVADTMSVCFSKGLGAPVGSMLLSTKENIQKARRIRKMLGGGMRQIGILAAAADYAVENHRSLLAEDHRRAKVLTKTITECTNLSIQPETVETNIVIFDVKGMAAAEAVVKLEGEGIQVVAFGPQTLRATFHFQIDDEDLEKAITVFYELFG